jgi:two-component system OmpR family response regulator
MRITPTKTVQADTETIQSRRTQALVTDAASVLVADDDADIREMLTMMLSKAGYAVSTAASGAAVIALLATESFDLVILDANMPDGTGFDACRWMRRNGRTNNVPVIMLTALADHTSIGTALEAGANSYIVKPARLQHVLREIQDLLQASTSRVV